MPNTPSASATVQSTRITLPAPGTNAQVDARSGITFDFNTNEATFERVGDDLQIKTDGGGTVTLTGFFVAEDVDALPAFTLADGQQVASGDFLKSLDVDITTAAGPSASSAPGSGGTSYADDAGSLLGGVDRLGSLGSDQWSRSTTAPETSGTVTASPEISDTATVAPGTAPESPETLPSPLLPDAGFPAVMRFVLLRDTPEDYPAMTGMCVEAAGSTQGATVQTEYGTATIAADGTITYTFTGTPEPDTQYIDYIKFTDANGNVHSVQVVVTDNPNYADDSSVYSTAGIINREAHDGTLASGSYAATSGDKKVLGGNDAITYTKMDGGSLATGAGQDTISISGGIRNTAINAGNEANTVLVGGMLGTDAGNSSIDSQGGTITVKVDKNADNIAAMSAQNGGRSSITTEDATILVDAKTSTGGAWGMNASHGDNSVKATGAGTIEVNAQGATWATGINAEGSGVNTLMSDTGDITVTANANTASGNAYGLSASGGENLLTNAAGIDITATGRNAYGLSASGGGKNTVGSESAKAGDVTILANMKDGTPTGSGMAYGLYAADTGSSNIIDANGSVVIEAGTKASHAQGMSASGGSNRVTAGSVTIDAQSKTTGTGISGGSASGMVADSGSNTISAATRVDINAQSTDRYAYGLHAQGGTNTINAQEAEVVINAASASGNAYGVYAPGGKNTITAEDLTIIATSNKGAAYGLNAMGGGSNTIDASKIDLTATSTKGAAYGMYASGSGKNILTDTESSGIEVHITVAAGSGAKAYALFASGKGTNTITGGTGDDFINIKGDIYADGSGKNIIDLSKGGNNTVILDGVVSKGGLTLTEGAGHDTLILKAANMGEFDAKFKNWLTDLYKNGIKVEDVKLVVSPDMSEADRDAYLGYVQGLFPPADKDKISLINQEDVPTSAPSSAAPAAASADLEENTGPSPAAANAPQPMQASLSRMAFAAAAFTPGEETQMTDAAALHATADASLLAAPDLGAYAATVEHADATSQTPETAAAAQASQPVHQGEEPAAQAVTDLEDAVHSTTGAPVLTGEDVLAVEDTASPTVEAGNAGDVLPGVHPDDVLVSLGHENDGILLNNVDNNAAVTTQNADGTLILKLDEGADTTPAGTGLLAELWSALAASQDDTMNEETLAQVFNTMTCTAPLGAEATETTCSLWQDEAAVQTSAADVGQSVFGVYQQDMGNDTLSLFMQQTIV